MIIKLALKHLFAKPVSLALTLVAVVSALCLLGSFWTLVENLEKRQVSAGTETSLASITLFVDPKLNAAQMQELKEQLKKDARIAKVSVVSSQEAMKSLGEKLGQLEEQLTKVFVDKSLDWTFKLELSRSTLRDDEWKSLLNSLRALPGVLDVGEGTALKGPAQGSTQKRVLTWASVLFSTVFLLVALLVSHLIRLAFEGNRTEIETMKVLGAPRTWMFMPLLIEGIFFGAIGTAGALLCLNIGVHWVLPRFSALLLSPGFEFTSLSTMSMLKLALFSLGASLAGALLTWPLIATPPKDA